MNISAIVGERIQLYRKAKHITQKELGQMIGKEKSVISKYESAQVVIDIQTLYEISDALEVPLSALIGQYTPASGTHNPISNFIDQDRVYMYIMHKLGRQKKGLLSSCITLEPVMTPDSTEEPTVIKAVWYNALRDINDLTTAQSIVPGMLEVYETTSLFTFTNRRRYNYKTMILTMNFLYDNEVTHGMAMTIASYPPMPITSRVTLAREPLKDTERLVKALTLNGDDWKHFKMFNGFTIKANMLNSDSLID